MFLRHVGRLPPIYMALQATVLQEKFFVGFEDLTAVLCSGGCAPRLRSITPYTPTTTRQWQAKQTLACKYLPETKRVRAAVTANSTTRMYRFCSVYLRAIFTPVYFRIPSVATSLRSVFIGRLTPLCCLFVMNMAMTPGNLNEMKSGHIAFLRWGSARSCRRTSC